MSIQEYNTDKNIEIHTPDGWQKVGKFYDKGVEESISLTFKIIKEASIGLNTIIASVAHLFQLEDGTWIQAGDLCIGDRVLNDTGYPVELDVIGFVGEQPIYDLEVLHENHRYYSQGISSHNSGKTTICLQTIVEAQKTKKWKGVFIDTEQTFDAIYAGQLGVNMSPNMFTVLQPSCSEEVMDILQILDKTVGKGIDYIILDSIAMTKPLALLTGENKQLGQHASSTQTLFNSLNNVYCPKNNWAVLTVNQLRMKPNMGSMFQAKSTNDFSHGLGSGYSQDNSVTTTGGIAYRFMMSARYLLEPTKRNKVEEGGDKVERGNWVRITCIKNKLAPPFKRTLFVMSHGKGIDDYYSIFDYLKTSEYIYYSGGWYFVGHEAETILTTKGSDEFNKSLKENHMESMRSIYKDLLEQNKADADEIDADALEEANNDVGSVSIDIGDDEEEVTALD